MTDRENVVRVRSAHPVLSGALGAVALLWGGACLGEAKADSAAKSAALLRSAPADRTNYARPLAGDEARRLGPEAQGTDPRNAVLPRVFMADTVVSNPERSLKNRDIFNDGETSIAVNPGNRDEVVVSSFSSRWGTAASIYHSLDRGRTWRREFSVPRPAGWKTGLDVAPSACPCDWTFDYGRDDQLSAAILASPENRTGIAFDVVTGTTTDPARAGAFRYFDPPPNPPFRARETNANDPDSLGAADQPWLLVNRAPAQPSRDNVYVAYDNFASGGDDGAAGSAVEDGADMRVAVSYGQNPPRFTEDQSVGRSAGDVNPGLRLARYQRKGTVWAIWQRNVAPGPDDTKNIDYMLNRSTDGGHSWSLNGTPSGIAIANADSTQPDPKFGTVNALLGGVLHATTDPRNGDVYYVYGHRDPGTGNDRLAIRRITATAAGKVTIGPERFVTGQVEAAIPQVAVTDDGTLGVFYYTFDGLSGSGFPIFTAHLAVSRTLGASFADHRLLTFLSSAQDNGDPRQRVLGDYMQMKAVGSCFYGAFTGNGVAFGRPFANHDPIFFQTCSR